MPQPPIAVDIVLAGTKKGYDETILVLMDDGTFRRVSFKFDTKAGYHYEAPDIEVLSVV